MKARVHAKSRAAPSGAAASLAWLALILAVACGDAPRARAPDGGAAVSADTPRGGPAASTGAAADSAGPALPLKPPEEPAGAPARDPSAEEPAGPPPPPVRQLAGPPLLPANRIVAYYGNPNSARMGILGALEPDAMMDRLAAQAAAWARADTTKPVLPALHLVAVVAQPTPGRNGLYRLPAPDSVVQRVARWAEERGWLLFLDIQPGRSRVRDEVERFLPLLQKSWVHLALDPEFAMPPDKVPGEVIGTMDAVDVNEAIDILARVVEENGLPPKVLVVHRFTEGMLTGMERIREDERVQVVIDMDGFGSPPLKRATWRACIAVPGVPFTGFKLFFRQDVPMMSEAEVLALVPQPLFVLYQ